tara:strand:+ start:167 stop:1177 length:1011 start_codon:yes stop_codon:yes gene_type:complete
MKKKSYISNDEIDLLQVVKIIWDGKIKIALIVAISILVGICYIYSTPKLYSNSTIIKPSKNSQFAKFQKITTFLNLYEAKLTNSIKNKNILQISNNTENYLKITNETILERFIEELMDYEELMMVIKNVEKKKINTSESLMTNQKQKLLEYVQSFEVSKIKKKPDYLLEFKWDNNKESLEIIDETIKLTLINFETSYFNELEDLLEVKKMVLLNSDTNKIEFLKEQSLIAKKLGISENQIENINQSQEGYYLRGFDAIDKEISLIGSRKYKDFDDAKKDINFLKEQNFNWINYNSFLIETNSIKNEKKILIISLLIGLIVGIFYTLISNLIKTQKS